MAKLFYQKKNNFIFVLILIVVNVVSCSFNSQNENQNKIPQNIIEQADEFIISKCGREFFDKYIKLDFEQSKFVSSFYLMKYKFKMPEKSFVDETIEFSIDTLGNIISEKEIYGIPDCINNPTDCKFNITKSQAKEIALKNNFDKGIKDWKYDFTYSTKYQKYVWQIRTTLSEFKSESRYRASGKEMIIAPFDGKVIEISDWNIL